GVVVHVLEALAEPAERLAAVVGDLDVHAHHVEAVGVLRIDDEVGVVLGLLVEVVAFLPGGAEVAGAEDATLLVGRLDDGVDDVGAGRGNGQADAAQFFGGQAGLQFVPGSAAVGRFIESAFGAAVDQRPNVPAALVGGGEQHVGVARVEDDVGHAGVFADRQHLLPGLAAVGGLVQPAVTARPPQRTLDGHVDYVGVAR